MDDDSASITRDCCEATNYYYAFNGKLMLISLLSLVAVFIIIASFHSYARWVQQRRRNRDRRLDEYLARHRNPRADYLVFNFGPTTTTNITTPRKGLERSVLKSLPTFFYDSAVHDPPLECAVCLSEFGDNELGRHLPKCNHCFHIDCIDMWFYSHSNCPLCRAPVKPIENPVQTKKPAAKTSVTETGSSSGFGSACHRDGGASAAEMVGITVESPTRNPADTVDPKEVDKEGFDDPGDRVSSVTTKKADDNLCKV